MTIPPEIPRLLGKPGISHRVETLRWGALCFQKALQLPPIRQR